MNNEPEPVILTDVKNPTLEINWNNDDPGNTHFVIGFILIGFAILCIWTLEEFCCLMGIFSLVSGFGFLFSASIKTHIGEKKKI